MRLISGVPWTKSFQRPIFGTKGNALRLITKSDFPICCVIEGYTDVEPNKAITPSPADEATDVSISPTLSWTSTPQIVTHRVFVNTALQSSQSESSYTLSDLDYSTGYTWRVDSSDGSTWVTGDTWTFTTEASPE